MPFKNGRHVEMEKGSPESSKKKRRTRGSGAVFKRPNGNYCVQYTDITGKKKTKSLTENDSDTGKLVPIRNRRKAEIAARAVIEEYQEIKHADTKEKHLAQINEYRKVKDRINIGLDNAWESYISNSERPKSGPKTLKGYRETFSLFLNWIKQNHPRISNISQIDKKFAGKYMDEKWSSGISERTYNAYLQALRLVFKILLGISNADQNPFLHITKHQVVSQSRKDFSESQVKAIFDTFNNPSYRMLYKPEMKVMINLCCWTGCRGQDACLMKWEAVNFSNNTISYKPEKTKRRKSSHYITIPLHPQLLTELKDALAWQQESNQYILPNVASRYLRNSSGISEDISKLLKFAGIETSVTADEGTRRKLRKVVDKNGKEKIIKNRVCQYSMHSFRHTFVSFCANAGVPLAIVQEIVGHGNPAMTRHYTHISKEASEKAINALPMLGISSQPTANEIIDIKAIQHDDMEPERIKLIKFAGTANLSQVKNALRVLEL